MAMMAFFLVLSAFKGRYWCGWLCPRGSFLERIFAPLLAMLNSCASGVTVVNIDNGFGAAYSASLINRLIDVRCKERTSGRSEEDSGR